MKTLIMLLFLAACSSPGVKQDDAIALISCRLENSCGQADAVEVESEEEKITQYCSTDPKVHKEFCDQRQLKAQMKNIESTVSDFTFEVHRPLYNLSEN